MECYFWLVPRPGPWFNIKMSSYQYRKSHCGDKTILRPSYLHNGVSYTGKTPSLYLIGAPVTITYYNKVARSVCHKEVTWFTRRWHNRIHTISIVNVRYIHIYEIEPCIGKNIYQTLRQNVGKLTACHDPWGGQNMIFKIIKHGLFYCSWITWTTTSACPERRHFCFNSLYYRYRPDIGRGDAQYHEACRTLLIFTIFYQIYLVIGLDQVWVWRRRL